MRARGATRAGAGTGALILALFLPVAGAVAGAPESSLRPVARPAIPDDHRPAFLVLAVGGAGPMTSLRPLARPRGAAATPVGSAPVGSAPGRGVRVPAAAPAAVPSASQGRAICGRRAIRGERLAPIPARLPGCGVGRPVRVSSVGGVALSTPAIMDCPTARALNDWVKQGVKPTIRRLGGGIASLQVIAGYSCRTRNNRPGAKISEHGKGHAIDIAAFNLKNGLSLSVLDDWRSKARGTLLHRLHRSACGIFGTVLGPDSDRFHRNHFHLDTARYRGGAYCR